jgi:hypothetical protein
VWQGEVKAGLFSLLIRSLFCVRQGEVKAGLFSLFLLWFPGLVTSGMPSAAHLSNYRIRHLHHFSTIFGGIDGSSFEW